MKDIVLVESHQFVTVRGYSLTLKNVVTKEITNIPIDSVELIIFEHPKSYFSTKLINISVEENIGIIFCNNKHTPCTDIFSTYGRSMRLKRMQYQFGMLQKTKDRLWKKIIVQKILNQATCLSYKDSSEDSVKYLYNLIDKVETGDRTNREAVAARYYFSNLFGKDFKRGRYEDFVNSSLNYGYSVLRSSIRKELAYHGFEMSYGIHHFSSENPFNLSDDILEAYRPFVDAIVYEMINMHGENNKDFSSLHRKKLISVLTEKCIIDKSIMHVSDAIRLTCNSLIPCYEKNSSASILLPALREVG